MLQGIIVGSGYFAPIQLDAWKRVRGAQIVGLVGLDESSVRKVADDAGVPHWSLDFDSLVAEFKPDFIDVCAATEAHGFYTRRAADLGLPVLCQKPIANTFRESAELVEYARRKGTLFGVNDNWRWQPWYREIASILRSGALGKPHHLLMVMRPGDGYGSQPYQEQPRFVHMKRFVLIETAVHFFDTARLLMGEIDSVSCVTRTVNPAITGEDVAITVLEFENGTTGVYDADRFAYAQPVRSATYGTVTVECSEGNIDLSNDGSIMVTARGGKPQPHHFTVQDGYKGGSAQAAQQHFVDVLNGAKPETEGFSYLRSMAMVEAAYLSAAERRTVRINEIFAQLALEAH